ncbi:DMT family transporter [Halorarum salinum]|uniref:EamA family transporter n=1 Tax=Halorarum salinum TaxID=2743089 RepID=A0A7D5QCL1_9EURY|nr:EamA family transporter [Halobaculum salinum]QLG61601.1 EamA family transporter [Halobaculum salinum]
MNVGSTRRAIGLGLLVTFLWSSSYVLIDVGLRTLPPLSFAALRYGLAAAMLAVATVLRGQHRSLASASRVEWLRLLALGVLLYGVTQGGQFLALTSLRAAAVSLLLTATPAVVAAVAWPTLGERPTARTGVGVVTLVAGAVLYFDAAPALGAGLLAGLLALAGNAGGAVVGRAANRDRTLPALAVTTVSMTVGALLLAATALATEPIPPLAPPEIGVVAWLAVVNTALAFWLWNVALRTLTAVEASVVNNTMLLQVAALGWLALGQSLSPLDLLALGVVGVGALLAATG